MSGNDKRDTVDANTDEGDLLQTFRQRERNTALATRTGAPAHVQTYDPATQTITALVGSLEVEDTGLPVEVPDPPRALQRVPVSFLRSMGGLAYITLPILPDDTGMLLCADRATEEWRRLGVPCDPVDARTHSLADAVFFPGLHPDTDPISPPTSLAAMVLEAPLINLGVGAVDFAIRGTSLVTALNSISGVLTAVPNATDPATVITLANANKVAILATLAAIAANLSAKVRVQ